MSELYPTDFGAQPPTCPADLQAARELPIGSSPDARIEPSQMPDQDEQQVSPRDPQRSITLGGGAVGLVVETPTIGTSAVYTILKRNHPPKKRLKPKRSARSDGE